MNCLRRVTCAALSGVLPLLAQVAPGPVPALHLTINYPSTSVISSMFGVLPKDVALIEVTACNDTAAPIMLSNGRIVQALRRNGVQALSRDAAISTMQASEGRAWQSILLRNATRAMNIVNFLVISKAVSIGPALSGTLPGVQALLDAIVPEFSKNAPDHRYLNFDRDTLPARVQLNPLDCATGLMFTSKSGSSAVSEVAVELPSGIPAEPIPSEPVK